MKKACSTVAVPLASAIAITLIAAPTPGQQKVSKDSPMSGLSGRAPQRSLSNASKNLSVLSSRAAHAAVPHLDQGGIAGATTDITTCFESGYTNGSIAGQNSWIVFPAGATGSQIITGVAPEGTKCLQNQFDAAQGAGVFQGAEVPSPAGVVGPGREDITFTINIGATGGADYYVDSVSNTAGLILSRVRFYYADSTLDADAIPGDILVVDNIGGVLQYVGTGLNYTPGVSLTVRQLIDSDANQIKYFINGNLVYTGQVVTPNVGVEALDFYSDNFHLTEVGKFDCIDWQSARGGCSADIVRNNTVDVNDLLAVVSHWGPCPAAPADCVGNIVSSTPEVVNVNDLLQVVSHWGACPIPTGACCAPAGTCSSQAYPACVATTGSIYRGNGSGCGTANCPQPAPDHIANAVDVTASINNAAGVAGSNAGATPPVHDGNPAGADPEIPANSPSCQWAAVPTDVNRTVWYKFVAPTTTMGVNTCSSDSTNFYDSIVAVYSGSPGSLVEVGCDDDSCAGGNPPYFSTVALGGLTVGNTYYVMVGSTGSWGGPVAGPFILKLTSP